MGDVTAPGIVRRQLQAAVGKSLEALFFIQPLAQQLPGLMQRGQLAQIGARKQAREALVK